ncbi:hypothetical protein ACT54F_11090, partial [Leptospira interrogans]
AFVIQLDLFDKMQFGFNPLPFQTKEETAIVQILIDILEKCLLLFLYIIIANLSTPYCINVKQNCLVGKRRLFV